MAVYAGIPLSSAVIVRHTPNDERASDMHSAAGAIPCRGSATAIDYISREGRFADKGDIDREPTAADRSLAQRGIDYISREGRFADKGAERQLDASLWGQDGPVSTAEARRQMAEAGGAFVDSIVTVKREHAAALGLDTKEAFQRLLRSTWRANVEQWGLIKSPDDIRWVAAYHTDASRSLHCHVLTWSAAGEIEPHATVGKEGTRRGKEIILKQAYGQIRRSRDRRETFLRDLSRHEAARLAGLGDDRQRRRRINDRAAVEGWPERAGAARPLEEDARRKVDGLVTEMRAELALGDGRLGRNHAAQAIARDVSRTVEERSPEMRRVRDERLELIEAHADLKALGNGGPERDAFTRKEREDQRRRQVSLILRSCAESAREPAPEVQRLDVGPDPTRRNVTFSDALRAPSPEGAVSVRLPGTRTVVEIPAADAAGIDRGRSTLAAVELGRSYRALADGREAKVMGSEIVKRLGEADMQRVRRSNPAQDPWVGRSRQQAFQDRQMRHMPPERRRAERIADRYGLDREGLRKAERLMRGMGDERKRDRAAREVARQIVASPKVQHALRAHARAAARADGRPDREHMRELTARATERAAAKVLRQVPSHAPSSRTAADRPRVPSPSAMSLLAGIAAELASDAGAAAASGRRSVKARQQEPTRERERER